jgi:hypothetical protein
LDIRKSMLKAAKERAKKAGVPFSLTESDILIPTYCPVFGHKLERALGSKGPGPFSPSLDRIVPQRGYVPGNVVVISNRANRAKSDLATEELVALAEWAQANQRD